MAWSNYLNFQGLSWINWGLKIIPKIMSSGLHRLAPKSPTPKKFMRPFLLYLSLIGRGRYLRLRSDLFPFDVQIIFLLTKQRSNFHHNGLGWRVEMVSLWKKKFQVVKKNETSWKQSDGFFLELVEWNTTTLTKWLGIMTLEKISGYFYK